ncbi:NAD(P)-dependent oxidoreductase [Paenibacillus athensensis]|uniref:NAD-dependent epimerase/dehydratase domain-containing protein n=1 Tax=Paenibacillus athensensis TaxID=1967502 RepID=A0A4Y8QBF7_9BACL|nr:NAD(P)-dependent oxidoreductase [Paenibacillus athensensis]MCD1257714.1 NAD(P)-dependent oxidoreductase [Paenibacillus athensensis]
MRIFVTGASGNIGRAVVEELLRQHHEPVCLVRRDVMLPGCSLVYGDLAQARELDKELGKAEAVIHLASPRSTEREQVVAEDILGTGQLLDLWRRGPFVLASSQTVYGIPQEVLREGASTDPGSWYDLGKICNEHQLAMAAAQGAKGAAPKTGISLRIPLLYGTGKGRFNRQYLLYVYQHCKRNGVFYFDSEEGLETYGSSFIGEADCGRAFAAALDVQQSGVYNVASGFCTWKTLIEQINRWAGTRARWAVRRAGGPQPDEFRLPQSVSLLDTTRFNGIAKFAPADSVEAILEEYIGLDPYLERPGSRV